MWTKKVIGSNPESKVIVGTIDVVETVCVTVRSLIGAIEPLNHLFQWAVFRRNSIVVGKSNTLSDFEGKVFPELLYEFHCSERIGTVTVSDELEAKYNARWLLSYKVCLAIDMILKNGGQCSFYLQTFDKSRF